MTKDKFRELCERVLVPMIGDVLHRELKERDDLMEIVSREIARISEKLDDIALAVNGDE